MYVSQCLSKQEIIVLNHLANAWNEFCKLEERLDHDTDEFMKAIHIAQDKIALRVARRVNPEIWRIV
jgi:hypothetical protein